MRLTTRKKQILGFYEPKHQDWVKSEIGSPPFDVSGVAYLLHQMSRFHKKHQVESTRRTLESMVTDGLLEKVISYERRQDTTQTGGGKGVWCNCSRYGLPGQCKVTQDEGGDSLPHIDGESIRID